MPAAIPIAIALAAAAFAFGSKKQSASAPARAPAPPTPPLDPGTSQALDSKIKTALATETNPMALDQMAAALEAADKPNAAAAAKARAAQVRGDLEVPGVPMPNAPAAPSPPLPPSPPAAPMPKVEDLDRGIPSQLASGVASLLAKPTLTPEEIKMGDALASSLDQQGYPLAAGKLRARLLALRAADAGSGLLKQINDILTTPETKLPPLPPGPPAGVPPIPGVPVVPVSTVVPAAPPKVAPGAAVPTGPLARTYKVVRGDAPYLLAQRFTKDGNRYKELAAANPDKSARILQGKIYEGETLTLPDAWPTLPGTAASSPAAPNVTKVATTAPAPGAPAAAAPATYKVVAGDSPYKIAQKLTGNGNRYKELAAANPAASKRILAGTIFAGETLTLPSTWSSSSPARAAGLHLSPDAIAGVLEIIGARHAHRHRTHRHHGRA